MQESDQTSLSLRLLRPLGQSRLVNMAGGVVNFGINSSTRVIKGGLHLVDRSVGTSVNLTKSAIGLVKNGVNLGCDLAVGVVDVGKNLTSGVIKNVEDKVDSATYTTKRILHINSMLPATKTHPKLQIEEEEVSLINRNRLKKQVHDKSEIADLTKLVMVAEKWNAEVNKESPIVPQKQEQKQPKKSKQAGVKKAKAPQAAGGLASTAFKQELSQKKQQVSDRLKAQRISLEFKNELAEKRREFERRRPKRVLNEKLKLDIQARRPVFDAYLQRQQRRDGTEFKRELVDMKHQFDQRREKKIVEERHARDVEVKRKQFQERKKHDEQVHQKVLEEHHDQEVRLLTKKEKKRQLKAEQKKEEQHQEQMGKTLGQDMNKKNAAYSELFPQLARKAEHADQQQHEQQSQEQLRDKRKRAKEEKLKRDVETKRRLDYEDAMKRDAEKRKEQLREKKAKAKKAENEKLWALKAENANLRETLARLKEDKVIAYSEHFPELPKKEEKVEQSQQIEQPKQELPAKQELPVKQELKEKKKSEQQPLNQNQEIYAASNVLSKDLSAHLHKSWGVESSQKEELPSKSATHPLERRQIDQIAEDRAEDIEQLAPESKPQEELSATEKFFVQHVVQPNISFADAVKRNPEEAGLKRKRFEEQEAKKEDAKEFHRDKHAVPQEIVLQEMKAAPIKTENPFDILNSDEALSA